MKARPHGPMCCVHGAAAAAVLKRHASPAFKVEGSVYFSSGGIYAAATAEKLRSGQFIPSRDLNAVGAALARATHLKLADLRVRPSGAPQLRRWRAPPSGPVPIIVKKRRNGKPHDFEMSQRKCGNINCTAEAGLVELSLKGGRIYVLDRPRRPIVGDVGHIDLWPAPDDEATESVFETDAAGRQLFDGNADCHRLELAQFRTRPSTIILRALNL